MKINSQKRNSAAFVRLGTAVILLFLAAALLGVTWIKLKAQPAPVREPVPPSKNYICTLAETGETNITDSNHPLVAESVRVILSSGVTGKYFAEHFKFLCAANEPSHRLVRWQFSVGEFSTILADDVGFLNGTSVHNRIQAYARGLARHEIQSVLSQLTAQQVMQSCIGPYEEPRVSLDDTPGPAKFYLIARSGKQGYNSSGILAWNVGYVDLETGECKKLKGYAIPGPLTPP